MRDGSSAPGAAGREPFDIVLFWRQNDTGIYGRRPDMLVEALARSDRVHRIIHFDRPLSLGALKALRDAGGRQHQGTLVYRQTLARVARLKRRGKVRHYTFLFRLEEPFRRLSGRVLASMLPTRDRYVDFVEATLARNGVGKRPTVFWVYPANEGFPLIADTLDPDLVVADVMDDQRTWAEPGSESYRELTENYAEILGRSDIVLANAEPLRQAMRPFAREIHLVPNASEGPSSAPRGRIPRELRRLPRPIVGYVGNLSSRIDLHLLDFLAREKPGWSLVFIGSTHLGGEVLKLSRYANVHLLGVKRHAEAKRYIRAFDVGIIPHLDNAMTQAMNPLKAFVYSAEGVPVVSTAISGLDELGGLVRITESHAEFVEAIESVLDGGRDGFRSRAARALTGHTWDDRARQVLELLDA